MITPVTPRAGSSQSYLLLTPPQLRLPAERLPASASTVMRKPSPTASRRNLEHRAVDMDAADRPALDHPKHPAGLAANQFARGRKPIAAARKAMQNDLGPARR